MIMKRSLPCSISDGGFCSEVEPTRDIRIRWAASVHPLRATGRSLDAHQRPEKPARGCGGGGGGLSTGLLAMGLAARAGDVRGCAWACAQPNSAFFFF